jgi:hypothetical protein
MTLKRVLRKKKEKSKKIAIESIFKELNEGISSANHQND